MSIVLHPVAEHPLSLDHLTVQGAGPEEYVEIAAMLDVPFIGPISLPGTGFPVQGFDLRPDTTDTRRMAAALQRSGVRVNNMDGFPLLPGVDWEIYEAKLDGAAQLDAAGIVTLAFDEDAIRFQEGFQRLGEMTRARGLTLILEFTPLSHVAGLADALAMIDRSGLRNHAKVLVDALHLYKSDGMAADVAMVPPGQIAGAQLCDGPANPSFEAYMLAAAGDRQLPGDGELPLADFIAALPPCVPIGLEVPLAAAIARGGSPTVRARLVVEASRRLIREATQRVV